MILVKIGGGQAINFDYIVSDIAELIKKGEQFILVHGANYERNELARKLGIEVKKITAPSGISSVYTTPQVMETILMSYAGLVNKKLVAKLQSLNVPAIGLTGADGRLIEAERKELILSQEGERVRAIRDDLSGKVVKINTNLLELLLANKYVPVLTIPAITASGQLLNVDNDQFCAMLVKSLKISRMVFLFEEKGLLKESDNPDSVVKKITFANLNQAMAWSNGRMKQKILGVIGSLQTGVKEIYFADGRIEQPISNALAGEGTIITN
ncbi:MAG: [LysW]-aminoadipate kinase [Patescibacteria group bacterium]|jgi:acetylglutamate/LysW-gamma-L-alpha-aminoadipate kinase